MYRFLIYKTFPFVTGLTYTEISWESTNSPDFIELGENKMSKSWKHEKTTGFLENAGRIRKARKQARDIKHILIDDENDFDFNTDLTTFAAS